MITTRIYARGLPWALRESARVSALESTGTGPILYEKAALLICSEGSVPIQILWLPIEYMFVKIDIVWPNPPGHLG